MLGISRQSYYKRNLSFAYKQSLAEQVISMVIDIRMSMPSLGVRKLYYILSDKLSKLNVGRDKLFKILKANNMLITPKQSYHKTTDSKHWLKKHKNIFKDAVIDKPEQAWVSDITYLKICNKHSYLSIVTDAYSRKIVGYDLSESLSSDGVLRAMNMAVRDRLSKHQLIHHSDRGLQYCSYEYQDLLTRNNILTSMTENSDPYENAIAERINGIIKNEFMLEELKVDFDTMKAVVKQTIDIYNNKRPHLSCNMQTPAQCHKKIISSPRT